MKWRAQDVFDIVDGADWAVAPDSSLTVSGASVYAPTFTDGNLAFIRAVEGDFGMTPDKILSDQISPPLAIVTDTGVKIPSANAVLTVPSQQRALFDLAKDARARLNAPVIGVTGSSGKTSVTAMIAHCLQGVGPTYATRFGANMARGIAWNLCCADEFDQFCVLEIAIGQMVWNSQLAQPDVAVFTNIHPAHLIYHQNLQTIAERKSKIFASMPAHGTAVINADMSETKRVQDVANARNLKVLTYGVGPQNDIFLVNIDSALGQLTLDVQGRRYVVPMYGVGAHVVENLMAVVATICALDLPVDVLIDRIRSFEMMAGRGAVLTLKSSSGAARILDHSYNANPASMRAALDELMANPCNGQRVAILGHMAELGADSQAEHRQLLVELKDSSIGRIYLLGEAFKAVISCVSSDSRFEMIQLHQLNRRFENCISNDDVVMVKGSNSTGLYRYMERYR